MCVGPADGNDEMGEEDAEEVVLTAGNVAMVGVEQADHVTVAVQVPRDELVGDDGGVVRALHGALDDFAVVMQAGRDAGGGEVVVVGEEEPEFHVSARSYKIIWR